MWSFNLMELLTYAFIAGFVLYGWLRWDYILSPRDWRIVRHEEHYVVEVLYSGWRPDNAFPTLIEAAAYGRRTYGSTLTRQNLF